MRGVKILAKGRGGWGRGGNNDNLKFSRALFVGCEPNLCITVPFIFGEQLQSAVFDLWQMNDEKRM